MSKKVVCYKKEGDLIQSVRVRVLKAPFVNTEELKKIVSARAKALVL